VLLFDQYFKVDVAPHFLTPYNQHHITIKNKTRRIDIKGPANRVIEDWMASIKKVQTDSPWMKRHRFLSFAPIRNDAKVKWFVDGHGTIYLLNHNKVYILGVADPMFVRLL
jgi:hypothetical protein